MAFIIVRVYSLLMEIWGKVYITFLPYLSATPFVGILKEKKSDKSSNIKFAVLQIRDYIYLIFIVLVFIVGILFQLLKSVLTFKGKGAFKIIASLLISIVSVFFISFIGIYYYLSGDVDPNKLKFYQELHQYRTATAIRDSRGKLIGAVPSPLASPATNITHEQRPGALYVERVPDVFWDVLVAEEDRQLSFNYTDTTLLDMLLLRKKSYKGIHIANMLTKPFYKLSGGSGLMNQIIKNIYGTRYFDNKCSISVLLGNKWLEKINRQIVKVCRKVEEVKAARHLFPYLARFNGVEFKRWSAMHTPMLVSAGDVYGLRAVAATVFGKTVNDLSDSQQAILAASYLYNIRFIPLKGNTVLPETEKDYNIRLAREKRWKKIIRRAKDGVKVAYGKLNPRKSSEIISNLSAISSPLRPKVPNIFQGYLNNLEFKKQQLYGNLLQRGKLFINGFDDLILNRLKHIYSNLDNNEAVTDLLITLPVIENNKFKKKINTVLEKITKSCKSCFNLFPGKSPSNKGALMKVIVADEQGRIVRYYNRGNIFRRPIASIAKLPAAILLASLRDSSKTKYCNSEYKGLKNASGPLRFGVKNCLTPNLIGHAFTFKNTIAASRNLPLFYALTRYHNIPIKTLSNLYNDFEIENSISLKGKSPNKKQLAYDLSFGVAESKLSNVFKFTHTITQTLYNSEFETDPYTIDQYKIADFHKSLDVIKAYKSGVLKSDNKIHKYLKFSDVKLELRKVLRAPVYSNNGTLRSFQNIPEVKFLFAKSGTTPTVQHSIKDKWSVGAFEIKNSIFTFLIFVGTTNGNEEKGLGNRISHRMLMFPIMDEIIKSLK